MPLRYPPPVSTALPPWLTRRQNDSWVELPWQANDDTTTSVRSLGSRASSSSPTLPLSPIPQVAALSVWLGPIVQHEDVHGVTTSDDEDEEEEHPPLRMQRSLFNISEDLISEIDRLGIDEFDRLHPGVRRRLTTCAPGVREIVMADFRRDIQRGWRSMPLPPARWFRGWQSVPPPPGFVDTRRLRELRRLRRSEADSFW